MWVEALSRLEMRFAIVNCNSYIFRLMNPQTERRPKPKNPENKEKNNAQQTIPKRILSTSDDKI